MVDVSSELVDDLRDIHEAFGDAGPQQQSGTPRHTRWSADEHSQLQQLLVVHTAERYSGPAERYIAIAAALPNKTARDVALRVKWMQQLRMQHGAGLDGSSALLRSSTQPGLMSTPLISQNPLQSSHVAPASRPSSSGNLAGLAAFPPLPLPNSSFMPLQPPHQDSPANLHSTSSTAPAVASNSSGADNTSNLASDELPMPNLFPPPLPVGFPVLPSNTLPVQMPQAQGCASPNQSKAYMESLLNENHSLLLSIKFHMKAGNVMENTELLARCRDNILAIMSQMDTMPGTWKQMPSIPVQLNLDMAVRVLPPSRPPLTAPSCTRTVLPTPPIVPGGPTMIGPTTTGPVLPTSMLLPGMLGFNPHLPVMGGVLTANMMNPAGMLAQPSFSSPFMPGAGLGAGFGPGFGPGFPPFACSPFMSSMPSLHSTTVPIACAAGGDASAVMSSSPLGMAGFSGPSQPAMPSMLPMVGFPSGVVPTRPLGGANMPLSTESGATAPSMGS